MTRDFSSHAVDLYCEAKTDLVRLGALYGQLDAGRREKAAETSQGKAVQEEYVALAESITATLASASGHGCPQLLIEQMLEHYPAEMLADLKELVT